MRSLLLIFLGICYNFNVIGQSWQWVQMETPDTTAEGMQDGKLFGDTAVVMGGGGKIFYSTNFFQSYTIDSTYTGHALEALEFVSRNTGYIETNDLSCGLLITNDGGATFQQILNGAHTGLAGGSTVQFASGDTFYIGSSATNYLYRVGLSFHYAYPIAPFSNNYALVQIRVSNDSTIYLLYNQGATSGFGPLYLIRSNNYGNSWQMLAETGLQNNGDFRLLDDTTIIVAGTLGIAKSTDGGNSFRRVMLNNNTGDGINSTMRAVYFPSHDTGFVAFFQSVYRTYDAGDTWVKTDFAFDSADLLSGIEFITASSSQKVIVGCQYGEIYKTTNGGGIATDITNVYPLPTLTISPNPTLGPLKINPPTNTGANYNVEVMNVLGQTIYKTYPTNNQIDVSNLAPGIYIIKLQVNGASQTSKFVKQ